MPALCLCEAFADAEVADLAEQSIWHTRGIQKASLSCAIFHDVSNARDVQKNDDTLGTHAAEVYRFWAQAMVCCQQPGPLPS